MCHMVAIQGKATAIHAWTRGVFCKFGEVSYISSLKTEAYNGEVSKDRWWLIVIVSCVSKMFLNMFDIMQVSQRL